MNSENLDVAQLDVEPPTIAQPTSNDFHSTDNLQVPQAVSPTGKKRHWGIPVMITFMTMVLFAGFTSFYYLYRTPNSEYDRLIANLSIMRNAAKIIPFNRISLDDNFLRDQAQFTVRKTVAKDYVASLNNVKLSNLLTQDKDLQQAYSKNKTLIEPYGQSTIDLIDTATILYKVNTVCWDEIGTLANKDGTYNPQANLDGCWKLYMANPQVPLKDFNEQNYSKLVMAFHKYYTSHLDIEIQSNWGYAEGVQEAVNGFSEAHQEAEDAMKGAKNNLHNTQNPTKELDELVKVAKERKQILFRR